MFSNQEPLIELSITYFWMKLGHSDCIWGTLVVSSTVAQFVPGLKVLSWEQGLMKESITFVWMVGRFWACQLICACNMYSMATLPCRYVHWLQFHCFQLKIVPAGFLLLKLQSLSFCFRELVLCELHNQRKVLSNVADLRLPEASKPHLVYSSSQQAFKGRIMALLRLLQYV